MEHRRFIGWTALGGLIALAGGGLVCIALVATPTAGYPAKQ